MFKSIFNHLGTTHVCEFSPKSELPFFKKKKLGIAMKCSSVSTWCKFYVHFRPAHIRVALN